MGLGTAAWDPARSLAARRAAAQLAFLSPEGARRSRKASSRRRTPTPVIAQAALRVAPRQGGASAARCCCAASSTATPKCVARPCAPRAGSAPEPMPEATRRGRTHRGRSGRPSPGCARTPRRPWPPSALRGARRPRATEAAGPSRASDGASLSVRFCGATSHSLRRLRRSLRRSRAHRCAPLPWLRSQRRLLRPDRRDVPGGGCGAWPHSAAPETDLLGLHASLEAPGSGRIPRIGSAGLLEFSTGEPIRLCRHQERYPSVRRSVRSAQAKPRPPRAALRIPRASVRLGARRCKPALPPRATPEGLGLIERSSVGAHAPAGSARRGPRRAPARADPAATR